MGSRDIEERTFTFAVRIVKLVNAIPRTTVGAVAARQLVRSGTSVGANVEEAQGSHSKRDFAHRMNVARREAREALYWLRLVAESDLLEKERFEDIIGEADELVRILTTIVKRSREG
ncbi:MAG: four helix bundle protein [Planctomycetes bacterium]|nr:four helix bundle protein [Planctomycetota bacterium]MCH8966743.1 four helix bundle protein [Planctomycetota bacterium]